MFGVREVKPSMLISNDCDALCVKSLPNSVGQATSSGGEVDRRCKRKGARRLAVCSIKKPQVCGGLEVQVDFIGLRGELLGLGSVNPSATLKN